MQYQPTQPDNDLLLRVLKHETVERPPVWLMRQAGRILPEYRAVRASVSGFIELVSTPELAAEVTIQPVDLLGVDAAILFSDILVIPEAMGLPYEMIESRGPVFPKTIKSKSDIEQLITGQDAASELQYVYDAIDLTLKGLNNRVPLIGFSGAPWTLFAYMVEGKGSKTFSAARKMLYSEPEMSHLLLDKITNAIIAYMQAKIQAGVHLVQIFDSWAGMLSPEQYATFGMPYMQRIAQALQPAPVTLFAKGAWFALEGFAQTECTTIGLDWHTPPAFARTFTGNKVLQGNFDPCALYASPEQVAAHTTRMLDGFGTNHIANLGHGVEPDTPLDSVKSFINTCKAYRY